MAKLVKRTYTKKLEDFLAEPMDEKSVRKLPGVGYAIGIRLEAAGFDKAYKVLGKYLTLNRNSKSFENWLKKDFRASSKQASACCQCLQEWTNMYL